MTTPSPTTAELSDCCKAPTKPCDSDVCAEDCKTYNIGPCILCTSCGKSCDIAEPAQDRLSAIRDYLDDVTGLDQVDSGIVHQHITFLLKEIERKDALLNRSLVKLRKYHEQTGGEYPGGEPLHLLTADIEKALSPQEE